MLLQMYEPFLVFVTFWHAKLSLTKAAEHEAAATFL